MTKLVGLTGSIGTGKSTVSQIMADHQVPIIDADQVAHQLQKRGTACYQAIVDSFGPATAGQYTIDRKVLGSIVFNDVSQLHRLNRIIDPYIRAAILNQIDNLYQAQVPLVVLDAPLLFESGYANYADVTVFVSCDAVKQVQRIKLRNLVGTAKAIQLIENQWSQSIKKQLSDIIINNSGSISQTKQQVLKLLDNLR
ncbi:dephospho-CoA kinase [Lactobacillaceae bacterium Scapto_B20]